MIVGCEAVYKGNIHHLRGVVIAGTVIGNIHHVEAVHLCDTAVVHGNISCKALQVDPKAVVVGTIDVHPLTDGDEVEEEDEEEEEKSEGNYLEKKDYLGVENRSAEVRFDSGVCMY